MNRLNSVNLDRITFDNFKALGDFSLPIGNTNILVGPNNSGKSTVVSALRVLAGALPGARTRSPERIAVASGWRLGYRVPTDVIPISLENVHTDYSSRETSVNFHFSNGNKLILWFPSDENNCYLLFEASGHIGSPSHFKSAFPFTIATVPILGPVEHEEEIVQWQTVRRNLSTHRASRNFRNYWYHPEDEFEEFSELVSNTWPGVSIEKPTRAGMEDKLVMFCQEGRIPRELFWMGSGFQVWCQLLTHLVRSRDADLIVVDEPEIYLHADLQRHLLHLLKSHGASVLATHSVEVIGQADTGDVVIVDKTKKQGIHLSSTRQIQRAIDDLGSVHNIILSQLARTRRVVLVEGGEFGIYANLARKLGYVRLANQTDFAVMPLGGFANPELVHSRITGMADAVGRPIVAALLLDRDFRGDEEVKELTESFSKDAALVWITDRKETENYLLEPRPIATALASRLTPERAQEISPDFTEQLLMSLIDESRADLMGQYSAKRSEFLRRTGVDPATANKKTIEQFEAAWARPEGRLALSRGKDILKSLRETLQDRYAVTLTNGTLIDSFTQDDVPPHLRRLFVDLDRFTKSEA